MIARERGKNVIVLTNLIGPNLLCIGAFRRAVGSIMGGGGSDAPAEQAQEPAAVSENKMSREIPPRHVRRNIGLQIRDLLSLTI